MESSSPSSWAPVSDGANSWVGLDGEDSCSSYEDRYSEEPEWGLTGEGSEGRTLTILCCGGSILGTGEEGFLYQNAAEKHGPEWYGPARPTTRPSNSAEADPTVTETCPYEAACPMSDMDDPMGGVVEDEEYGSWVPTSDTHNGWISAGPEDTCEIFDVAYGGAAERGIKTPTVAPDLVADIQMDASLVGRE